jgi:hypothetical protein
MKQKAKTGIQSLIFIIILIIINPFTGCTKSDTTFYDKVLNDFDTNSYFIALDIKSSSYKGRVIIENKNLYNFLYKTKGLDKEKYKSLVKRILVHHKVVKINNRDISAWKFIKISELGNVIHVANQGENRFIAHYFDGTMLKYGIKENEQNAIINQLFYWHIPSKIDKNMRVLIIG